MTAFVWNSIEKLLAENPNKSIKELLYMAWELGYKERYSEMKRAGMLK